MTRNNYEGVAAGVEITPVPEDIVVERDVMVAMQDGVKLALNVYRPAVSGKYPVVMCMTIYGKDAGPSGSREFVYQSNVGVENGFFEVSALTAFEAPDPVFWVKNGYAVVYVDARGCHRSEGTSRGPADRPQQFKDYYHVIEWAGVQEWSNGNVGLLGVSALAEGQYYVSGMKPPHLKAIIPWECFSDQYRDMSFPGGIPETLFWQRLQQDFMKVTPEEIERRLDLDTDPVSNQPLKQCAVPIEKIETPMLICASWSDKGVHTRGSFEVFRRSRSPKKWLFNHGGIKWDRYYSQEGLTAQKEFFDHHLKGNQNGWPKTPPVRLEIREELDKYEVRFENEWPLARTKYAKWYLDPGDGLLRREPVRSEGSVRYNPVSGGDASFGMTFEEDTELTGYMMLKLWVSPEGADDMDLFVGVRKFDAMGNEVQFRGMNGWRGDMVTRGQMRVSQRELDQELSTHYQPVQKFEGEKKLALGEIVPVEVALLPSGTRFKKSESLRLFIQGRELVVHPMIGYRRPKNKGEHVIYAGGKYDSYLQVPVIP